ncbi:collagen alpha-1(XXII) chain-like [Lethenteron reissneri]|uniref:collagen alpha-1(XXII) chain-like n=1 Tax=Lethenteron reissneri TaxID=7753 RepID=UPI002AB683EF|nr:collagen alpha-1(XXII) chain-like [Lethenteron reissneri]
MKFGTVSAVALAALVMASLLPGPALAQGDPFTSDEYWNIGQEGEPEPRSSQGRDPWATSGESGPTPEPPPESVLPTIPPVATLSPPPLHLWFESGEDDSAAYLEDAEAMLGASHDLCRATPMDLVFVLDGSRSVLAHNFVKVKHFVNALVDSFSVGPSATRVAVVQYSSRVRTEFTLGEYDSKEAVKAAVMRMSYMEEGTVTGKALSHMTEKSFSPEEGARPKGLGVRRVAIVMTDGRSADDVKDSARAAHEDGILVFALGVTDSVDVSELDAIASKPSSAYMHHVDDFDLLSKLHVQIVRKICEGLSCLGATGRDGVPGTDLVKEFGLATAPGVTSVEGSSSDHPAFHLDASASLIKDTVSLHPFGLPNEFALVATLRLPIAINSEAPWSLWSARSPDGEEQASLLVDGPSRSVEFSSRRSGRHTFGQLDALFDGEWHKLALSSRHGRVALLVDCRAAGASDVSEARDEAVVEGGTTVVARRADGSTVPIDVQQLQVYCDPERASLEVCCELPNVIDTRCAPRVLVVPTPPPLPSPQPAPAAEPCTCRIGRLGQPGFPGTKGPKGNKGESGFPGKQGRAGYRGFKGARGRTGDGGLTAALLMHTL